ncbi:MAG: hypothetical protein OEV78_03915 [Spirochaetia bacterium]|nr:hypothetical protein [Spirochaetia bacterium]
MKDKKSNLNLFNQSIQSKLNDEQWDTFIVQKILLNRKKNIRKWSQLAFVPCILIISLSIFYASNKYKENTSKVSKEINQKSKIHSRQELFAELKNNNFKIHLMNVVFNKAQ